ncbi:MAG: EAL domain-containing protein [Sphingomonadales bacterium]
MGRVRQSLKQVRGQIGARSGAASGTISLADRRYAIIRLRRWPIQLLSFAAATALVGWLWFTRGAGSALPWAFLFTVVEALRFAGGTIERIGVLPVSGRMRDLMTIGTALASGSIWGLAAATHMPNATPETLFFFIILIVTVLGMALIGTASVFAVAAAAVAPMLLLPAAAFVAAGDLPHLMLAVLALAACVVFLWGSYQIERLTLAAFRIEQEKVENEVEAATQTYRADRYKDLLDHVMVGSASAVVIIDPQLRIVFWNERFTLLCETIGIQPEKGMPYEQVVRSMVLAGDIENPGAGTFVSRLLEQIGQAREGAVFRDEYTHFDGQIYEIYGRCSSERLWVLSITDVTDRRQATTEALVHMSHHDNLTGLPNRTKLRRDLSRALVGAQDNGHAVTVLIIDLNDFKGINETLGYDMGDTLLVDVARTLAAAVPENAVLSRFAADEFAVIIPHGNVGGGGGYADTVGRTLLAAIRNPRQIKGKTVRIAASIGTASSPRDGREPERLLRAASVALHHAKREGRDSITHYESSMFMEVEARTRLEHDILHSLDHDHFSLYYQPQIDLGTNRLIGVEALLRWNHPERGWISPASFIAVAELSKLIIPLTEKLLENACRQVVQWGREGLSDFRVAFNLSPFHVRDGGVYEFVDRVLAETGLSADRLELELTESAMASDSAQVIETLRQLDALGVTLAIDDFGTGYSSMSYLRQLPVDKVKIDRSFISELTTDDGAAAIVETIIRLAHTLGLKVTAEGIETPEQLGALRALGCDYGQGFLFARPMPAPSLARWCRKWADPNTRDIWKADRVAYHRVDKQKIDVIRDRP